MRPQKVIDQKMLAGLAEVFRAKGYEGASLNDLAEATGLKKASLYHRFPDGKQAMANAVIDDIENWVEKNIVNAFLDTDNTPQIRLKNGLSSIRTFYDAGNKDCIFRALSMQTGLTLFGEQIRNGMDAWVETLTEVGSALGKSKKVAQSFALQTLIEIQGSLIVSRGMNDITVFDDVLKRIEKRYLNN
ncbi:transcriptional regulator [Nonlabens ulvanivorans]|uniref:Transcriptional regulator n=1 Tax=Nonlabens ulvanivorans TaxID=906888 RepID=A0A090X2N2_NONUL|nr:TetR/AcrR family transcriptional regulator [Nonlabens ulvanivorans]GAL74577.1 transcriptional regulator [Nonlabens ulvanivorans]